MYSNQLNINLTKSVFIHFRPQLNNTERQTCASARVEKSLKLANHRLTRVTEVKFLGIIKDEQISWEPQINHLKKKLISSIIVIKRIKQFIPKNEYLIVYNSSFKSHISYCISCWGGISQNRLKSLFSVKKTLCSITFGEELSSDHAEYYQTCSRTITYTQHKTEKNLQLEHTKPLFNEMDFRDGSTGGVGVRPPQLGSRPKLGGAGGGGGGGWKIFTKMCKKKEVLLKNEGKIVIQEKSFACGEQLL